MLALSFVDKLPKELTLEDVEYEKWYRVIGTLGDSGIVYKLRNSSPFMWVSAKHGTHHTDVVEKHHWSLYKVVGEVRVSIVVKGK